MRFLVILCLVCCSSRAVHAQERLPNFILINCDDLGYADVGCYGSTKQKTPHIDRLAAEGLRLTSFYSTSGVCTPSRTSLMTGCYPRRLSMHTNGVGYWCCFPATRAGCIPTKPPSRRLPSQKATPRPASANGTLAISPHFSRQNRALMNTSESRFPTTWVRPARMAKWTARNSHATAAQRPSDRRGTRSDTTDETLYRRSREFHSQKFGPALLPLPATFLSALAALCQLCLQGPER